LNRTPLLELVGAAVPGRATAAKRRSVFFVIKIGLKPLAVTLALFAPVLPAAVADPAIPIAITNNIILKVFFTCGLHVHQFRNPRIGCVAKRVGLIVFSAQCRLIPIEGK